MTETDYYSVMRQRMDYLQKKYDPLDKFSVREPEIVEEEVIHEKLRVQKPLKIYKKISAGYSYIISMLF